jgi:subtilisin family serine protease
MSGSVKLTGCDNVGKVGFAQNPLSSSSLGRLRALSSGTPNVLVALIDGPVDFAALGAAHVYQIALTDGTNCDTSQAACQHGTAIAGLLVAPGAGICPDSTLVVRPIFTTAGIADGNAGANLTDLTLALQDVMRANPHVINLSLVVDQSASAAAKAGLRDVLDAAADQGVLVVAATVNSFVPASHSPLLGHPWVLPIIASDALGNLAYRSQLTPAIRRRAIAARGLSLTTVAPGGGSDSMSGTSAATAIVAGTAALLRAIFPQKSGDEIRWALTGSARIHNTGRLPHHLDAWAAYKYLAKQ